LSGCHREKIACFRLKLAVSSIRLMEEFGARRQGFRRPHAHLIQGVLPMARQTRFSRSTGIRGPRHGSGRHLLAIVAVTAWAMGAAATSAPVSAAGQSASSQDQRGGRSVERHVLASSLPRLNVTMTPVSLGGTGGVTGGGGGGGTGGGIAGVCDPVIVTHTSANFSGGSFVIQQGFAEQEIAAVSYTIPSNQFPIRLDLAEMIFAVGGATVTTTTHWSFLVWEGTPDSGAPIFSYSSDGVVVPHIVLPPGTNGVNVQAGVDPGDPEQIIIQNNGSSTFSVGYRIDMHHDQTQNPCLVAPPADHNAFPTTDTGGLHVPTENWLFGVNCGPFGCPANGGWARFSALPFFCTPSGDWVIRATYTPIFCADEQGGCCLSDGSCEVLLESECSLIDGTFLGDGTTCVNPPCAQPLQACCFQATGGCLNLTTADCAAAGGIAGGQGTACATYVCFPMGACCLVDGSCQGPLSPAACAAQGGSFQGHATTCAQTNCPLPTGACCFATGFCLVLTEADCAQTGAPWSGAGTNCADANGNGTPDGCEVPCPADCAGSGDGVVNVNDLLQLLSEWDGDGNCDFDDDGEVDVSDLLLLLGEWGTC
jgi:hypothetical protein